MTLSCCLPPRKVGGRHWPGTSPLRLHQPVDSRLAHAGESRGPRCLGCLKGQSRAWGLDKGPGCGGPGAPPFPYPPAPVPLPHGVSSAAGKARRSWEGLLRMEEKAHTQPQASSAPARPAGCGQRPRPGPRDSRGELATVPGPTCCAPFSPFPWTSLHVS